MRSDFVPVDAAVRRQAIETLDRPLLVEAGAGTGKTALLVERMVHALERGVVQMPGLVAISFTEKAAAELRLRLRRELERRMACVGLEEQTRTRLEKARRELDRATLSTIHAFAAALLRERPVQAMLDPQFRTLDELESIQLLREFWGRWVDAQLDLESAAVRLRAALLAGVQLEPDLFDLARELELQRDVTDVLRSPRPDPALENRMRALRDHVRECRLHAEANCEDPSDRGLRRVRELDESLDILTHLEPSSWPGVFLQKFRVDVKAGQKAAWRPGTAEQNKALRTAVRAEHAALRQAIADTLLHGILEWLATFRADYAAEKRRRGVLDFQDLLLEARQLVRDDPRTRRDLGARIDMLCVDEFQDTDPLQAELVLFLAEVGGPAADWRQVSVGSKLFLVGDPKQSIYRFRRADLDVYARCAQIVLESGGLRLDITQNFRSRPAVLQWVNGVFEHLFNTITSPADPVAGSLAAPGGETETARPFSPISEPRHVPLQPLPEWTEIPAVWILNPPASPADGSWRRREAKALAAWIRSALESAWPVRDESGSRPLRAGDIALLFGRTSGIEHYESALRDAGLPFQQEGGRLYFQRQEVRDLLHALAAIDDPHDELSIVAALRSPLFGVTDEELWLHRSQQGSFGYLQAAPDSPLAARFEQLERLHAARLDRGAAETIAALLDATEARAVLAARPQGVQALANVERLMRLARHFEAGRPAGLREFVRSLRDIGEDAPRIAEWAPQDTEDRIRLLTVHMAKGLEFPCVVLANLNAGGNTQRAAVVVDRMADRAEVRLRSRAFESIATADWERVVEFEKLRDEAEERRLLYVAATRARDYLLVPSFAGQRSAGSLRMLQSVPGAFGAEAFGELPAPATVPGMRGAAWCVVESESIPSFPPTRVAAGGRVDLNGMWRRRREWQQEHAARLSRAAGGARVVRPDGPELAASWSRLRPLLAGMLREGPVPEDIRTHAEDVARRAGAPELAAELRRAATAFASHPIAGRAVCSERPRFGVQFTAWDGRDWIEAWLDLVLEEDAGAAIVEFRPGRETPGSHESLSPAEVEALLWKVRALGCAQVVVHEAGVFFLDSADYLAVSDLEERLKGIGKDSDPRLTSDVS